MKWTTVREYVVYVEYPHTMEVYRTESKADAEHERDALMEDGQRAGIDIDYKADYR